MAASNVDSYCVRTIVWVMASRMTFGALPAAIIRFTKGASVLICHLLLSAHLRAPDAGAQTSFEPMRSDRRTVGPELCSTGESPAKAANPFA